MPYEPRNEPHLRYATTPKTTGAEHKKLMKTIHDYTLLLNKALGYDFNTVEFAVRNGVPIAIDFCNPAPDADVNSVGQENFEWIVEHSAKLAIEMANAHKSKQNNSSWGTFVQNAVAPPKKAPIKSPLKSAAEAKKAVVKKAPAKGKSVLAKTVKPASKKAAPKKAAPKKATKK